MKRKIFLMVLGSIILMVGFITLSGNTMPASAAPRATGYTIDWYTVDGGGAMNLQGGTYTLSGTIGQPNTGIQSGGNYKFNGGFWGFLDSLSNLFLPLITR